MHPNTPNIIATAIRMATILLDFFIVMFSSFFEISGHSLLPFTYKEQNFTDLVHF